MAADAVGTDRRRIYFDSISRANCSLVHLSVVLPPTRPALQSTSGNEQVAEQVAVPLASADALPAQRLIALAYLDLDFGVADEPLVTFGSFQVVASCRAMLPHLLFVFVPVAANVVSRRRFGPAQVRYVGSMGENDPKTWFAIILFLLLIIAALIWYGALWDVWG